MSDARVRTDRIRLTSTANVGLRLVARAVDFFLVLVVVAVGSLIPGTSETSTATAVSFSLVAIGVSIYEACLLRWWGRTPGKALFGLSVMTTNGQRVPLWRGVLRAAIVWVGIMLGGVVTRPAGPVILAVALASMVGPMLVRDDHRGLHDLITGTVVSTTPR